MALTQVTDHVARALARMPEQFKNNVTQPGIVVAFASQVQEIEDAAFGLLAARSIDLAVGTQLDRIGKIIGAPRMGAVDADYRLVLKATILINRRSGEIETMLQILAILVPGCTPMLAESPVHAIVMMAAVAACPNPTKVRALLALAKMAGVKLVFKSSTYDAPARFCFAGGAGLGFGAGHMISAK